jgi:hypothetical protein
VLVIRKEQLEALDRDVASRFEGDFVAWVRQHFSAAHPRGYPLESRCR